MRQHKRGLGLFVGLLLLATTFLTFNARPAAAVGEVYTWSGGDIVSASGGAIGGTPVLFRTPDGWTLGGTESATAFAPIPHASGCNLTAWLTIAADGTTGSLLFSEGPSPLVANPCDNTGFALTDGQFDTNVAITGVGAAEENEEYTWLNPNTIQASGGAIGDTPVSFVNTADGFVEGGTENFVFVGQVPHPSGCTNTASLTVAPNGTTGTVAFAELPAFVDNPCNNAGLVLTNGVYDSTVTIGNLDAATDPIVDPEDPGAGGGDGEEAPECSTGNGFAGLMAAVICPLADFMTGTVKFFFDAIIRPFLTISPLTLQNEDGSPNPIRIVWENVNNLTNIAFIAILLVIIISQATSVGLSNFGIKKALGGFGAIVVGSNLSYAGIAFAIDVSNLLGSGVEELTNAAIAQIAAQTEQPDLTNWLEVPLGIVGGIVTIGPAILLIFPFIVAIFLAVFGIAVAVLIRHLLIILLTMIAPVAFLLAALPGTQGLAKRYRQLLVQLLVMYPFIMFGAAAGKVFGSVLRTLDPESIVAAAIPLSFFGVNEFLSDITTELVVGTLIPVLAGTSEVIGLAMGVVIGVQNAGPAGLNKMGGAAKKAWGNTIRPRLERTKLGGAIKTGLETRKAIKAQQGRELFSKAMGGRGKRGSVARGLAGGVMPKITRQGLVYGANSARLQQMANTQDTKTAQEALQNTSSTTIQRYLASRGNAEDAISAAGLTGSPEKEAEAANLRLSFRNLDQQGMRNNFAASKAMLSYLADNTELSDEAVKGAAAMAGVSDASGAARPAANAAEVQRREEFANHVIQTGIKARGNGQLSAEPRYNSNTGQVRTTQDILTGTSTDPLNQSLKQRDEQYVNTIAAANAGTATQADVEAARKARADVLKITAASRISPQALTEMFAGDVPNILNQLHTVAGMQGFQGHKDETISYTTPEGKQKSTVIKRFDGPMESLVQTVADVESGRRQFKNARARESFYNEINAKIAAGGASGATLDRVLQEGKRRATLNLPK